MSNIVELETFILKCTGIIDKVQRYIIKARQLKISQNTLDAIIEQKMRSLKRESWSNEYKNLEKELILAKSNIKQIALIECDKKLIEGIIKDLEVLCSRIIELIDLIDIEKYKYDIDVNWVFTMFHMIDSLYTYTKDLMDIDATSQLVDLKANGNDSKQKKLIVFDKTQTVTNFYEILEGYFVDRETDLLNALEGKHLKIPLLFSHNQNKLVEVFRRAKYNRLIISTNTEIKEWLCHNFQFRFKLGKKEEIRKFNPSTVWDTLTKGKNEPPKKERICSENIDWLPYKSMNQLEREAEEEQK